MTFKIASTLILSGLLASTSAAAQEGPTPMPTAPVMTMGNGEANAIQVEGITRAEGVTQFTEMRVDSEAVSTYRGDAVTLVFPEVILAQDGFIVLHPVMDGRPNGDVVSGFAYLEAGAHTNVAVRLDTPADPGRKFLVMLHTDVDADRVLDFVFVEDGVNVQDTAVTEGTKLIAQIFAVPG